MLYGTITEFCTEESCPIMSAGPKYEYHWADGQTVKKPIKCSAPKYIDYLMTWVQDQLDDENLFPSKIGQLTSPHNVNKVIHHFLTFLLYHHRCSIPQELSIHRQNNLEASFPCLCPYLPSAFSWSGATGRRSPSQYLFQAFHLLCSGIVIKIFFCSITLL